jgi:hypothetical protein
MVVGVASAEVVIDADFSKGESGFSMNQDAKLVTVDGKQFMSLTQNFGSQTGTIWSSLKRTVPSFSYIIDLRIRFNTEDGDGNPVNECPADGVAVAFAPVEQDAIGGGGGGLGISGIETLTAFDINTWRDQGTGSSDDRGSCATGKGEAFAFDVVNPDVENPGRTPGENGTPEAGGTKIGQVNGPAGFKLVNGGWYRYQWDALADGTMRVYVTGLEDSNKQFSKVKLLEVKFPNNKHIAFEGRFGAAAATGGAVQHTDIARIQVNVPVLDAPQ